MPYGGKIGFRQIERTPEVFRVVGCGKTYDAGSGKAFSGIEGKKNMSCAFDDGNVEISVVRGEHVAAGQSSFHVLFQNHKSVQIFHGGAAQEKFVHRSSSTTGSPREERARERAW